MIIPESEKIIRCKPLLQLFFFVTTLLLMASSCNQTETVMPNTHIIPSPEVMTGGNQFSAISKIEIDSEYMDLTSQFHPWILAEGSIFSLAKKANCIFKKDDELSMEGYGLSISKDLITISYKDQQGIRNALITIDQLHQLNQARLPIVEIKDEPRFSYRGMHLDVSRHMYSTSEIKKYIDYLHYYKYNYFHWHLTDDQGWRIEIKKYPKLQEISAYRDETLVGHYNDQPHKFDGQRYGGYYSQEEVKDIVGYAKARGIEVIPEIDIPGHSTAILAAYPEFGCAGRTPKTATKWGVFFDILCPKEITFQFLEDVFEELSQLFPSEYVHIGGDECPKDQWNESSFTRKFMAENDLKDGYELQSYFIQTISDILSTYGKRIIGWDEILEGGLAKNAMVMSWRGDSGGITAARQAHEVIMTPTSHCYFDYYQSENENEPLAIGGFIPIEKVYSWEVIPRELEQDKRQYILGGQGNVWTEYISTFEKLEYMALSRMIALSEVLWSTKEKNYTAFATKLYDHTLGWETKGVNISNHLLDINASVEVDPTVGVVVKAKSNVDDAKLLFRTPSDTTFLQVENDSVLLKEAGIYSLKAVKGNKTGYLKKIRYTPHKGNKAKITLLQSPADKYSGNGPSSVVNGIYGPSDRYGGSEWLGFEGDDFEAQLEWLNEIDINRVQFKFFKGEGQWIYLPKSIELYTGTKDGEMTLIGSTDQISSKGKIANVVVDLEVKKINNLRIKVNNFGIIPDGRQGSGHPSWLFVDEIVIE